ncbi:MAG: S46 family peptidase [Planctomycetota bacterium]|nr:S46 family peptidase [Planctomycetota bacterium]
MNKNRKEGRDMRTAFKQLIVALIIMTGNAPANSDEGMWLYNDPPRRLLKDKYGFESTQAWLEHVQKSSVRFNSGGSGSFVSEDGLIISNHHVGADTLQKFSDAEHNYYRDGFHARAQEEEKRCLDLELNVLISIDDVTDRVNAAVKHDMSAEEAFAARRAVMAEIEKESLQKTGLRSDVVTLYQGGKYHLYCFKKYTDVRLVFAPEYQTAFFGGDPDNFEYPRFDLDICLFRAYENGKPARVEHYLRWSLNGVSEGDLVFVSGHPGNTSRQLTVAELEYLRDQRFPYTLQRLNSVEVMLLVYSTRSDENARRAKETLFGVQNSRKAREGMFAGLLDPQLMVQKQTAEQQLRAAVAQDPNAKESLSSWGRIADAQQVIARNARQYNLLEEAHGFNSTLFHIARTISRAVEENTKPNGERLREFRDSNLESLEFQLFSEEPLYDDFEQVKLAHSLTWLVKQLGYSHPLVQKVLAGESPRTRAAELVLGTKVKDVALRKRLYVGTAAEVEAAHDPMIELARLVDTEARAVRKIIETQSEIQSQAHARIAQARFAVEKTSSYPDATFTLRLAFGTVKGYEENGQAVPMQTTFAGLYERAAAHHYKPPFDIPQRWTNRKDKLDLSTPFNFVSTADIIGGNSGSPVVNRHGEFVGIIFDGNLQSLVLDFAYTDVQARAVSVNSQAIVEALRKVYDAGELADEIVGKKRP